MSSRNWSLTSDVDAYIVPRNMNVYLAASGVGPMRTAVLRLVKDENYITLKSIPNEFRIKIDKELNILIKNPKFSKPDEYYKLNNFLTDKTFGLGVGTIISQVENNKGDWGDKIFELAYSEIDKSSVFLVNKEMDEYNSCFEEMRRRVYYDFYKKTKKLEPGHVYYSKDKTLYCLACVKSRKSDPFNSDYLPDNQMTDVYLVTEIIKPGTKNISEVLNNSKFGFDESDIYALYKNSLVVDGGEVLKNDIGDDIRKYWPNLISNTIKNTTTITKHGYEYVEDLRSLFEIFCFNSPGHEGIDRKKIDEALIKEAIKKNIESILVGFWEINKGSMTLKKQNSEDQNKINLLDQFYSNILDGNVKRENYYKSLFKELGISIEALVSEVYKEWKGNINKVDDFEEYLKKQDLFFKMNRRGSDFCIDQRSDKTRGWSSGRNESLNSILGNTIELEKEILELINYANNNSGMGVEDYKVINLGTRKSPLEYIVLTITTDDILKHKKGVEGMSEILKNEIKGKPFQSIEIFFDKGATIK